MTKLSGTSPAGSQCGRFVQMPASQIPDAVWNAVAGLLPDAPARTGRPRLDNRRAFSGVLYVRLAEINWNELDTRAGFGSGRTCLRRLNSWTRSGVWAEIERTLARLLADGDHGEALAEQLMEWRRQVEDALAPGVMRTMQCAIVDHSVLVPDEGVASRDDDMHAVCSSVRLDRSPTKPAPGPAPESASEPTPPRPAPVATLVLRRVFVPESV